MKVKIRLSQGAEGFCVCDAKLSLSESSMYAYVHFVRGEGRGPDMTKGTNKSRLSITRSRVWFKIVNCNSNVGEYFKGIIAM